MGLFITQEEKMIKQTVQQLARSSFEPIAAEIDRQGRFPHENLSLLIDHGLFGINVPENYGGHGASEISHLIAIEEIAKVCCSTSVILTTQALAASAFLLAGTEEQKQRYLRKMANGVLGAFGITEPEAGSDVGSISTEAKKVGDSYILNGTKCFITNAEIAEIYTIVAKTDKDKGRRGISLFIVDKGTPGLKFGKTEDKMGIRGSITKEVILEDCQIPEGNMLGGMGEGFKIVMQCLDYTRAGVAAQALGVAQGALELAIDYAKNRVQFGNPIAGYQGIQFAFAEMAAEIEAARSLTYQVGRMIGNNENQLTMYSAMAKMLASDVAMKVTTNCVQVMGGYGYMRDYPVERMMRDAKITQIYEGTNEIQKIVIANQLLK